MLWQLRISARVSASAGYIKVFRFICSVLKKRGRAGPRCPRSNDAADSASDSCSSLAAIANAFSLATTLFSEVILARNVLVNERLAANGLQSVDVIGDGNCAFRSIAVCLTGTENGHLQLRRDIVRSMIRDSAEAVGKSSSAAAD